MPPKRRGGAAKGAGGKKAKPAAKKDPPTQPQTVKDAVAKLKTADAGRAKKAAKVDSQCGLANIGGQV